MSGRITTGKGKYEAETNSRLNTNNMDGITVKVLQTWFPTLQKQEELQKLVILNTLFIGIPIDRLEKYASILNEISHLHDHGEANIEIQIRDGEITNEMYGKRIKKH